jgi:hypothetical protein
MPSSIDFYFTDSQRIIKPKSGALSYIQEIASRQFHNYYKHLQVTTILFGLRFVPCGIRLYRFRFVGYGSIWKDIILQKTITSNAEKRTVIILCLQKSSKCTKKMVNDVVQGFFSKVNFSSFCFKISFCM